MSRPKRKQAKKTTGVTCRRVLQGGAAATVAAASGRMAKRRGLPGPGKRAVDGRLPQSIVHWCYSDFWKDPKNSGG